MLLRLAQLAIDRPEIDQVDINPLIVGPAARAVSPASCVVDARVRLLAPADGAASRS
jgi:hypothetical protein